MKKPLKALLLCAGLGTRLRPITNNTPKCLVEINNRPILEYWLLQLEKVGCEAVLINTHYLNEKVSEYIAQRKKSNMRIEVRYEKSLLGTAGTLIENEFFFENSTIALIHSDNMTSFNLNNLLEAHKTRPVSCLLTMLAFTTDSPQNCGIVITDKKNILKGFFEKVDNPPSNIANGAIYIFDNELLHILVKKYSYFTDFSNQVIPIFIDRIFVHHTKETLIDIGTPNNLRKARELFGGVN